MESGAAAGDGLRAVSVEQLGDMEHQVGGHTGEKAGLKAHDGKVFKPFQSGRRGEREHEFYERVLRSRDSQSDSGSSMLPSLIPLIPRYFGIVKAPAEAEGSSPPNKFLVLEDLTAGRVWPCVMDVKVGTRSFEADASPDKIAYERSKFPLQETAGFRLQGFKTFDPATRAYIELDKHAGRAILSVDELAATLGRFLPVDDAPKRAFLIHAFLKRLATFQAWFDQQQEAEFIASSLLFLYNGEPVGLEAASDSSEDEQTHMFAPDIRLIDFAHVTHPSTPQRDEGVRTGLQTLVSCFRQLQAAGGQ